jgi:hypothetical protein
MERRKILELIKVNKRKVAHQLKTQTGQHTQYDSNNNNTARSMNSTWAGTLFELTFPEHSQFYGV